jgi:hypothetical protein
LFKSFGIINTLKDLNIMAESEKKRRGGYKPGQSGNPAGRPKGVKNKVTTDIRRAFERLVEGKLDELSDWLRIVGNEDPEKALKLIISLAEFTVPKLSRTEVTGEEGKAIKTETKLIVPEFKNMEDWAKFAGATKASTDTKE